MILAFGQANDDINALFDTDHIAVQADVIIVSHAPGLAGIVMVVDPAALILFSQTCLRALLGFAVPPDDPVSLGCGIGMDKDMEDIGTVLQNVVRIPATMTQGPLSASCRITLHWMFHRKSAVERPFMTPGTPWAAKA